MTPSVTVLPSLYNQKYWLHTSPFGALAVSIVVVYALVCYDF